MSAFQGDPRITIGKDGANLVFREGQPVLDRGLENAAILSLFTSENWVGNALTDVADEKIGSDFEESMKSPLNLTGLNARKQAAESALKWMKSKGLARDIDVTVSNPSGSIVIVRIVITPPQGENVNLTLENFGPNWKFQREDPAHRRL